MYELPLFPLNTVLFPGIPLLLHIFEERYKQMIAHCLANKTPFGVNLIRRGSEALGPLADPYPVGCSAEIVEVQRMPDGRMHITAVGRGRFRITGFQRGMRPFLLGEVEDFPLQNTAALDLDAAAADLRGWVERYVQTLVDAGKGQFDLEQLPAAPIELAYTAAALVQAPPEQKQRVLETPAAPELVAAVSQMFRREIALVRTMLVHKSEEGRSFSRN